MKPPRYVAGTAVSFNLWHYDLSLTLFQERLKTITPHQPQVVATSCSGCWLQFQDGLHANGSPVRAFPLIELLALPYEKEYTAPGRALSETIWCYSARRPDQGRDNQGKRPVKRVMVSPICLIQAWLNT